MTNIRMSVKIKPRLPTFEMNANMYIACVREEKISSPNDVFHDDSCLFIQIEQKYMFQTFHPLIFVFSSLTVCLIVTSIFVRFESFNGQTNFLIDIVGQGRFKKVRIKLSNSKVYFFISLRLLYFSATRNHQKRSETKHQWRLSK